MSQDVCVYKMHTECHITEASEAFVDGPVSLLHRLHLLLPASDIINASRLA